MAKTLSKIVWGVLCLYVAIVGTLLQYYSSWFRISCVVDIYRCGCKGAVDQIKTAASHYFILFLQCKRIHKWTPSSATGSR